MGGAPSRGSSLTQPPDFKTLPLPPSPVDRCIQELKTLLSQKPISIRSLDVWVKGIEKDLSTCIHGEVAVAVLELLEEVKNTEDRKAAQNLLAMCPHPLPLPIPPPTIPYINQLLDNLKTGQSITRLIDILSIVPTGVNVISQALRNLAKDNNIIKMVLLSRALPRTLNEYAFIYALFFVARDDENPQKALHSLKIAMDQNTTISMNAVFAAALFFAANEEENPKNALLALNTAMDQIKTISRNVVFDAAMNHAKGNAAAQAALKTAATAAGIQLSGSPTTTTTTPVASTSS